MKAYDIKLRKELAQVTKMIVVKLTPHLQEDAPGSFEGKTFFYKICGDFCRYMYECRSKLELEEKKVDKPKEKLIWGAIRSGRNDDSN